MASVGELSVDVKARINDFSKNLNNALSQANGFANRMSTIGKKDFFAPVQETIKGMSRDFKQIIQGIVLAQTFYSGLQLFKQLTAAVYEYTDALNYAQVTFSNLFRDVSLGEEFVAVLQQYAARSPFDFTDIEKGARQLSAYGIQAQNLMYVMEGIGNLSAVTGDPQTFDTVSRAMGQIYSKGKLSAEEMRQLAEAGLNVKEVYARLGVEAGKVGSANIDAATALNTIVEVLNDTYAGAMDAANTTMRGMLANTKDVLLSVSSAVFQPAYEKLQRVLKWIQIGIDTFQKTFTTDGLSAAIEKVFGAEARNRIQQFIAISQYLGNLLFQLLAPALKIVGTYGETFITVFGTMVRILAPVIELFAALLNTFVNSAQGARLLQTALMGLVVIKMVGGLVDILSAGVGLMGKTLTGVVSVVSAASGALAILTGAEAGAATGAYGAAAAWKYFTKTLNVNPLVLALTIILSLIAAVMGLRAVLGQTTDALANMSGVDFSKFMDNIKQATGDASKFSKPFEDAGDNIEDANKDLDKTKKKLEGLLSFDEVFKLPEKTDTSKNKDDDSGLGEWEPGDLGEIKLPDVEPLDPRDLLPNIDSIFDWFKDQPWWKIGQYISNGIASGFKMAKQLPTKAVADLLDDLIKTAGKALDKFNIKSRLMKLADKAAESRAAFKDAGKLIGDAAYEALERELGPEKAKKLKLKERLGKIAKEAAKGEKAWAETGRKMAQALEEDLAKELGPEKARSYKITEQLEDLAKEASKAEAKFAKAGEKLAKQMTKEIQRYLGPQAVKELKIAENLERIAKEAAVGGKAWEEGGAAAAREWLEGLNREFAKASIKGKAPEKAMVDLAKELKAAGVTITDVGVELSDEFIAKLETGLSDKKSFGEIASEFGKGFVDAFKSLPKNISSELAKSFTPAAVFAGIQKSFTNESGESIFKAFITPIKNAITPAKIAEFLKTGLKDMGITIIGEMLFDELAKWLDNNGMHEASVVMGRVGPILASGLGTAIATKSPWGFVVGAIWGALFEDLGKGLETGNWSGFIGQAAGSLGVILAKIAPRLGAASAGGPAGWIGAIGSMVSDLIFGSIIQNLRDSGDDQTADILDAMDGAVGGALGGAGLGATIGSIFPGIGTAVGAIAGAIIGALAGFLTDNWGSISNWWNTTAVPWFQALPGRIQAFFSNAGQWLVNAGSNVMQGFFNGIGQIWTDIKTFFSNILGWIVAHKGPVDKDRQALVPAGKAVISGFFDGIKSIWENVKTWFLDIPGKIGGFFSGAGEWLVDKGKNVFTGLKSGFSEKWDNVSTWIGERGQAIQNKFANAGNWLTNAGKNVFTGLKSGLNSVWTNVSSWLGSRATDIQNKFANAGRWLTTPGKNMIAGFKNNITTAWSSVSNWLSTRQGGITGYFKYASTWLGTAGWNVIIGFYNKMVSAFKYVQDFVSGIAQWIIDNKGPIEYDKTILEPAGEAIMYGLNKGLEGKFQTVMDTVSSFGGRIEDAFTIPQLGVSRADAPTTVQTPATSTQTQDVQEVSNPFLNQETETSTDQRPIMYVGTLIADKQGLRELKKKLDIVDKEQSRYR